MSYETLWDVRKAGHQAYIDGASPDECPYDRETEKGLAMHWDVGWMLGLLSHSQERELVDEHVSAYRRKYLE